MQFFFFLLLAISSSPPSASVPKHWHQHEPPLALLLIIRAIFNRSTNVTRMSLHVYYFVNSTISAVNISCIQSTGARPEGSVLHAGRASLHVRLRLVVVAQLSKATEEVGGYGSESLQSKVQICRIAGCSQGLRYNSYRRWLETK